MVTFFKFPDVGEGITEGRIRKWLVKEGDRVKEDQVLAEVETDKAVVEMPSPAEGTILRVDVGENDKVRVGGVLVVIGEPGEKIPEVPKGSPESGTSGGVGKKPHRERRAGRVRATPRVRKLAEEKGVDLAEIEGTGPGGRITEEDVLDSLETKGPGMKVKMNYDFYGHIRHQPLTGLREAISKHMKKSFYTAPHANSMDEADVTGLWEMREQMNREDPGNKLSILPFVVKAVVRSLVENPMLNAEFDEVEEDIIIKEYYSIGIATATDEGLIVPVIKRAEDKDIYQIERETKELVEKARARTLDMMEMKGGTFTITNYGALGGWTGVPIINYPEVAILGIGQIRDMPRVVDGNVVPRKVMALSVSIDHRVIDGAHVAGFINALKGYLEEPERILEQ